MNNHYTRPSDAHLGIKEGWADGKPARRVLSAIGHPGYGEAFARRVLSAMATDPSLSAHQAVYGLRPA